MFNDDFTRTNIQTFILMSPTYTENYMKEEKKWVEGTYTCKICFCWFNDV